MWQDNIELLHAYYSAAKQILATEGRKLDALDISTGPCLAPLMATMQCMDTIQLSDFDSSNRERIVNSDINYWRDYARELAQLFTDDNLDAEMLLRDLDILRHQKPVIHVDLRSDPVFSPDVIREQSVGLLTMHFVVDSICESKDECFSLLDRALRFVRPGGWLLLSALIESHGWKLGHVTEPSPNIEEGAIDKFFAKKRMDVLWKARSTPKKLQIYDGTWTVFLTKRRKS